MNEILREIELNDILEQSLYQIKNQFGEVLAFEWTSLVCARVFLQVG